MEKFPQELVFALIFGALWLVQFLFKRLRNQGWQSDAEPEPEPEPEPELELESGLGLKSDALVRWASAAGTKAPWSRPLLQTRVVPAPPPPRVTAAPGRRFSRRSLMGSRRAMQDAIVIAAILGPCRASQPHDID
ncbi:MAG: hypothetical protein ACI83P_001366 [Janthinobacterium sp.]|jgi:hypothetical protein